MKVYPTLKSGSLALGLAVMALGTHQAEAVVMGMNGGISLHGGFFANHPDLLIATEVTIAPAMVTGATGSFAAEFVNLGDPASFGSSNPLMFDPITLPGGELYTFGDGLDPDGDGLASRFSFTLLSLMVTGRSTTELTLFGNGVFKDSTGEYADTYGTWKARFKGGSPGAATYDDAIFGFESSSNTTRRVPDGGTSVALLGLALLGMQGIRSLLARK